MEATVCPWCHTEIVWDEEIGPEKECPYCHNELDGYRTISVHLDEDEGAEEQEAVTEAADDDLGWDEEGMYNVPVPHTLQRLQEEGTDLGAYQDRVQQALDGQEEVPECPQCREYMLLTGTQEVTADTFKPAIPALLGKPVMQPPFHMNVYVCTSCFHIQHALAENDRVRMIKHLAAGDNQ
ncbi:hypothetical protein [Paenibacillus massiliensis]|uniref:hypothetical protein n=1 Tax=Paenibacillus massiliensis TaxID=225917 RepID=UPI00046E62CB|nr:hypothetical protein [Paenibacillus massiliensis]